MRRGRSAGPGRTETAERVRCQSLDAADGRKFDSCGDAERLSHKTRIERFGVPRPSFLLFEPRDPANLAPHGREAIMRAVVRFGLRLSGLTLLPPSASLTRSGPRRRPWPQA